MRVRTSVLIAAVVLSAQAGGAHAAAGCNLIEDAKGDASYSGTPNNPSLDIVTGDVATDAKTIGAAIRVDALAEPSAQSPLGQSFLVNFTVKGAENPLFLGARIYPTGNKFVYGYIATDPVNNLSTRYTLGDAQGVVDLDKDELRIWTPLADFASQAKITKGSKLGALTAESSAVVGQGAVPAQHVGGQRVPLGGVLLPTDDATGKSYTAGAKSCLTIGK